MGGMLAVCLGASCGALLRWGFNQALNSIFPAMPLGTLAVNWLGGFIMGVALGLFALYPALGGSWRLLLVTGFLGAFTTFSAFSAEMAALILAGRLGLCAWGIFLHVAGSIGMVFAGLGVFAIVKKFFA